MTKLEKKRKYYRIVSFFLLINIIGDLLYPTCALALTGGPSQPEFESFEPASTNQMVDLFTGDFNYNIPLLNIPGPNGGYPVNLAYHAGPTMEQEASWVGLGWNINPGVINRNLRGLPDDFNGDLVRKEYNLKPRKSFDVSFGRPGFKIMGIPFISPVWSAGITYDNYKGFGISGGVSSPYNPNYGSLSLNYNTQDGMGLELSPSKNTGYQGDGDAGYGLSVGFGSREGMTSWGISGSVKWENVKGVGDDGWVTCPVGFAASTQVPTLTYGSHTSLAMFDFKIGTELVGEFKYNDVKGSISTTNWQNQNQTLKAYGYCYSENNPRGQSTGYLLDFNRENDYPVTNEVEALPMPVMTNDLFTATAEGMAGSFRVNRSDIGILSDPTIESKTDGFLIGAEFGYGNILHAGASVPFIIKEDEKSGRWADKYGSITYGGGTDADFHSGDDSFTFKFLNELNTDDGAERGNLNSYTGAESLDMNLVWDGIQKMFVPQLKNSFNGGTPAFSGNQYRPSRRKKDKLIEYKTREDLQYDTIGLGRHVFIPNINQPNNVLNNLYKYDYTGQGAKHFGDISIVKPDGFRYEYGIPVYQNTQQDVVFSVNANTTTDDSQTHTIFGFNPSAGYAWESPYNLNTTPSEYNSVSASAANSENNTDQFFQKNTLPPYAGNFLLTAVYSPDYVDLTGNGPSNDDMGYYVKYNYQKVNSSYNWRTPYTGVFLSKGDYSNVYDDKESYMYGTKEIWYLNSIETKTHVAIFYLLDRNDGIQANEKSGAGQSVLGPNLSADRLKKLDHINLYSQADLANPIQTVNFAYDYSLCKGIKNNVTSGDGKLTLLSVSFSYLGNNKGQLSPYTFQYQDPSANTTSGVPNSTFQNPNYGTNNNDRWGNYKIPYFKEGGVAPQFMPCGIDDYPYVNQDMDYNHDGSVIVGETSDDNKQRNFHASAWCLRQIGLPSGGQINIDYEQDDYAYVQDQEASDMFQIVSTGRNGDQSYGGFNEELYDDFTRLYFELKRDPLTGNLIKDFNKYLPTTNSDGSPGNTHIYFKTLVELKSDLNFDYMARDYVEGYLDIVNIDTVSTANGPLGYVTVATVPVSNDASSGACHPIRKAAWQHLKLKRPDLLYPQTNTLSPGINMLQVVISIITDAEQLILGYYHTCQVNMYAKKLELDGHGKPSFIRLKDPNGHKKGGGYRVRRITYNDNWSSMASDYSTNDTYGQEYSYLLTDGKSSGVASYEPLQGGEENPFKLPSKSYSPINGPIPFKSLDLYLEKPYGEKYYPAPIVGYSMVTVKNIDRTIMPSGSTTPIIANQKSLTGVSVTEFYTAKDFPVRVDVGDLHANSFAPPAIPIPLIGELSFENRGYSQGFAITLNNMHGQLKSQATYAPMYFINTVMGTRMLSNPIATPQAMVQYFYNTNSSNQLDNNVQVLYGDGMTGTNLLGQTAEEFIDLRENSSKRDFSWLTINADFFFVVANEFWIMPWLTINYSEKMYRSAVHNKIIYQTGILSKVVTTKDGSSITMKNLTYDANTGEPLLTSVTNNFDNPVYTYNKPAYWAYPAMGPAGQNYRYSPTYSINATSGYFTVSNNEATTHYHLGDIVLINNIEYWVTSMVPNTGTTPSTQMNITLTDRNGNPYTSNGGNLTIIKSGCTNQQDLKMGHIVGLTNPVTGPISTSSTQSWIDIENNLLANTSIQPLGTSQEILVMVGEMHECNTGVTAAWHFSFIADLPVSPATSGNLSNIRFLENGREYYFDNIPANIPLAFFQGATISIASASEFKFSNNAYPSISPFTTVQTQVLNNSNGTLIDNSGNYPLPSFVYQNSITCNGLDNVLQASAMHYTDHWGFNYADIGGVNGIAVDGQGSSKLDNTIAAKNPYRFGAAGIWRPLNNWAYIDKRSQTPPSQTANLTQIDKDGTFLLDEHDWTNNDRLYSPMNPNFTSNASVANNPNWTFVSEITKYNPFGYVNEKVDALGVYSTVLYGYKNSVKTAEASNASYFETAFEGFEDLGSTYQGPNGHVAMSVSNNTALTYNQYHTGYYTLSFSNNVSLSVPNQQTNAYTQNNALTSFAPILGSKYLLSFWVKRSANTGAISVTPNNGATSIATNLGPIVDGWQKVDYSFMAPTSASLFTLQIATGNSSTSYIDDIRIQPFTSAMKSYVYDPNKLWLLSELDNRNYATFYNYDEEGQVVQVKKETEKGIVTVKTSRNNVRRSH